MLIDDTVYEPIENGSTDGWHLMQQFTPISILAPPSTNKTPTSTIKKIKSPTTKSG
jgi:hypothetical protein